MKKPPDLPDKVWSYLRSRYRMVHITAMFSKLYKPNGKREQARRLKKILRGDYA